MKPVAPTLPAPAEDEPRSAQPSLHTEILRVCDTKAADARITIPAPPTEEALRASTPFPPPDDEAPDTTPGSRDTTPAPPPSSPRRRTDSDPGTEPAGDALPSTIPGPPRMPRVAGR
jgi:hypothetical protein